MILHEQKKHSIKKTPLFTGYLAMNISQPYFYIILELRASHRGWLMPLLEQIFVLISY